jgi:outer membrane protein assembly factor BamD (BamD/ComL family)
MPEQRIVIEKMPNGSFRLDHQRLLNAVENLLAGYMPDISDLYIEDGEPLKIHNRSYKQPKPLD